MPDQAALDMGTNSRFQPALSATSDAPQAPAPTPTPNTEATGTVENEGKTGVDSASAAPAPSGENTEATATSDDAGEGSAAKPQHKGGFQKRIDELTKQREEFRREKEEYARRLDETLKLLQERKVPERTELRTENTDDPKPSRDQFDDPDLYIEAVTQWSTRDALRKHEAEVARKAQETQAAGEFQKVLTNWHESRTKAVEKYPDYESVAENPDIQVAQHVGMALLHVPNGHDVLYWLGQNPTEAARISALGAPHAAIEIGKLSERLNKPAATSKAPAPVNPIAGARSEAAGVSPEDDPNYMERRLEEMRKKRT
jgi:hypothetical protein